jgi:hypothetical protein
MCHIQSFADSSEMRKTTGIPLNTSWVIRSRGANKCFKNALSSLWLTDPYGHPKYPQRTLTIGRSRNSWIFVQVRRKPVLPTFYTYLSDKTGEMFLYFYARERYVAECFNNIKFKLSHKLNMLTIVFPWFLSGFLSLVHNRWYNLAVKNISTLFLEAQADRRRHFSMNYSPKKSTLQSRVYNWMLSCIFKLSRRFALGI